MKKGTRILIIGVVFLVVVAFVYVGVSINKIFANFTINFAPLPTLTETATSMPSGTPTPTPQPTATEAPLPEPTDFLSLPSTPDGLGITRQHLIDYFNSGNAFDFDKPATKDGMEYVMGYHQWLCVKGDCAAITILGPSDNVLALSMAVPMNPKDKTESMTALTLLMNTASFFDNSGPGYPSQLANDIWSAWQNDTDFSEAYNINGLVFAEKYDSSSHIAVLLIVKYSDRNSINS
jgi:hypothetical protein